MKHQLFNDFNFVMVDSNGNYFFNSHMLKVISSNIAYFTIKIINPWNGEVIYRKNELVTETKLKRMAELGIENTSFIVHYI